MLTFLIYYGCLTLLDSVQLAQTMALQALTRTKNLLYVV